MKKIILSIAIVLGLNSASNAQQNSSTPPKKNHSEKSENASPEERAKHGANWAEKKLALTADQKSKWEAAALVRINANKPNHDKIKGSTTPEERKEIHKSVKANNEQFDNAVNAFLTADQKTKWEAEKKAKREKHKEKMKGKKGVDDLDLDIQD